jgi:septum formation protein
MKAPLILASASPRRLALLREAGFPEPIVRPALAPEPRLKGLTPEETVLALALSKARDAAARSPEENAVVLGADTIVVLDGAILGKPRDEEEAAEMLRRLSGRCHGVYTGLALLHAGWELARREVTQVYFRDLSPEEIAAYVASGEPLDKAGAYGIQGRAGVFVRRLEGDYFSVVGLPLCLLTEMLKELDVELL